MEHDHNDSNPHDRGAGEGRRHGAYSLPVLILFFIILIVPAVVALYLFGSLPIKHSSYFSHPADTSAKAPKLTGEERSLSDKLFRLELTEDFLSARLKLAQSDSVGISINLSDKVVTMEIEGVVVRECKILDYKITKGFSRLTRDQLVAWLSDPFTLQRTVATILKAPVVYVKAPKDTTEANEQQTAPTLPADTTVYFRLFFDRNLTVDINQEETPPAKGKKERFRFRLHNRYFSAREALRTLFRPKDSPYHFWIRLELSREDARIIYRALPEHALMALRLE
jgi:hypothetical protein